MAQQCSGSRHSGLDFRTLELQSRERHELPGDQTGGFLETTIITYGGILACSIKRVLPDWLSPRGVHQCQQARRISQADCPREGPAHRGRLRIFLSLRRQQHQSSARVNSVSERVNFAFCFWRIDLRLPPFLNDPTSVVCAFAASRGGNVDVHRRRTGA